MRAVVLKRIGEPLTVEQRPEPVPRGDEVLVRVRGVGVCRSDLHLVEGKTAGLPLPLVLGHEIAGEVDGLGPVIVMRECWRSTSMPESVPARGSPGDLATVLDLGRPVLTP